MKRKTISTALLLLLAAAVAVAGIALTARQAPAAPPQAAESKRPPEDFIPTEQLPADSAISFPVDI